MLRLDGGLSTQLEAQGASVSGPLWTAGLINEDPQAIVDAHTAFLEAGANVLTSASYQASRDGFMRLGLSSEGAAKAIGRSVRLAEDARSRFVRDHPQPSSDIYIAASVGPYAAAGLHDGSEYTGIYDATRRQLREFHEERLKLLDSAGADFLACETLPNIKEIEIIAELLRRTRTPAWVSFCCRDPEHLSDGTPVVDAAALFCGHPGVFAVGINCVPPSFVAQLVRTVHAAVPDKQTIAYPNSGRWSDSEYRAYRGMLDTKELSAMAASWRSAGADIVGGCCGMGPREIKAIHAGTH